MRDEARDLEINSSHFISAANAQKLKCGVALPDRP